MAETTTSERPPGEGLRERKKAQLRQRIVETALDLFRERGYEHTTVEEIVRRVDVSQPTFYNYFPSKEAILREHATRGFGALLRKELSRKDSVQDRMRRFLRAVAEQMMAERELWLAIAVSNAYNPVRDPDLLASPALGTRVLEAVIEEGQRRGEFTREYSAQQMASALEGIMIRVCIEWGAGYPEDIPLTTLMDRSFAFFMRAAAPAPGERRSL